MSRPSWDEHHYGLAVYSSGRATCPRRSVGCVLVVDNVAVSTGYNGAPRKAPQCNEIGCLMVAGHCVRAVHAEANAVASAARRGVSILGSTAYVTIVPCRSCIGLLVNAGIVRIVYGLPYSDSDHEVLVGADALGLVVDRIEVQKDRREPACTPITCAWVTKPYPSPRICIILTGKQSRHALVHGEDSTGCPIVCDGGDYPLLSRGDWRYFDESH